MADSNLNLFLCFAIFAAVIGMFQLGYNTGVINAPKNEIENFLKKIYLDRTGEELPKTTLEGLYSIIVSAFNVGGMLGALSGGNVANSFGRKGGLLLNNLFGVWGGILMWISKTTAIYELLIVGRFIIGVHCGMNTVLAPMYVSEIAPINLRGALGTVNQLAVTIGIVISQVVGIEQILGNTDGWPTLLGITLIPAVLQILFLPLCPESPRYLFLTKQKEEDAKKSLFRLRSSSSAVEEDMNEMKGEIQMRAQSEPSLSIFQLLKSSSLRAPLVCAVVMQLSQQLNGINAIFYYSTDFFTKAGLEENDAKFASIGIGSIMVVMTLVSIVLMDRAGRRSLHLIGLGGMFIFTIFMTLALLTKDAFEGVSYLAVIFTLSFVVFFAVGPGSIPWLITAELFSQGPRPAAMSIACLVNWLSGFLVSISFLPMQSILKGYVFLPFSVLLVVFWIFIYIKVPETKNKSFEEISALFQRRINNGASTSYEATVHTNNPQFMGKTKL